MIKLMMAVAAVFVSGMVWAAPVDLTTQQLACDSATANLYAGVLTQPGGESFIFAQDADEDGAFSNNELSLAKGTLTTTSNSEALNEFLTRFDKNQTGELTPFSTIQEISLDIGDAVVTFHYGFEAGNFPGAELALLSVVPKDGSKEGLIPFFCQAYVPQN